MKGFCILNFHACHAVGYNFALARGGCLKKAGRVVTQSNLELECQAGLNLKLK